MKLDLYSGLILVALFMLLAVAIYNSYDRQLTDKDREKQINQSRQERLEFQEDILTVLKLVNQSLTKEINAEQQRLENFNLTGSIAEALDNALRQIGNITEGQIKEDQVHNTTLQNKKLLEDIYRLARNLTLEIN